MKTTKFSELLTLSGILPFPECHILEIMKDVAFLDWLRSLGNLHLMSFYLCAYALNNNLVPEFIIVDFIHPPTEGHLGCSGFGNYE